MRARAQGQECKPLVLTGEEVRAGLPQFERLVVELAGAAVGPREHPLAHGLDALLAVGAEEDDDGVPLCVVQRVHSLGRHVQQRVLVLVSILNRGG